ncbi:nucleotide disphospho-sugar-binding domain-containing protein [Dactylosporangium sp. CA-092794]|uniref:nucleotide disphospho-sugar-binding domain-containing protein n=1 Tax=Dactylosporangium sp. CA-092794 TaxID=3239929 RepID=UPI003D8D37A6
MRVLITCVSVTSHLLPIVPLAMALRAGGHEVLVAGQPDLVAAAGPMGLSTATVGSEAHEAERRARMAQVARQHTGGAAPWQPTWEQLADRWRQRVDAVVEQHLDLARRWRADLIIGDPLEFSALIVGALLGIPAVVHRWGPETMSTQAREPARRALGDICHRLGLPDGLPEPALVLDPSPPSFACPDAAPARPIRFVPFNGAGSVPGWVGRRGARHRICVSLGSMSAALGGRAVLDTLLPVLDSLPEVETIVLGAGADDRPGRGAGQARLVDSVPFNLFAGTCDLVAHHGGSGSGLTAIAFGLPQLVLPQFNPALAMFGARVRACGIGITLEGEDQRAPETVAGAVRDLLGDPRYRARTARLGAEMRRQPSPAELVAVLERLTGAGSAD